MKTRDMSSITRMEFIRKFRALGFDGPKRTGSHLFMHRGSMYVRAPGVDSPLVSPGVQRALLRQLEIDEVVWEMA